MENTLSKNTLLENTLSNNTLSESTLLENTLSKNILSKYTLFENTLSGNTLSNFRKSYPDPKLKNKWGPLSSNFHVGRWHIGNPKVWRTEGPMDRLTWVGARDACASKKCPRPVIRNGHWRAYSKFTPDLSQIHNFEVVTSSADDKGKEHKEKHVSSVISNGHQYSEFRIHAWPPPKMHSYKWDIAAYWLQAVQMYECWPHDWCGAINFAVHNQKWRKYPLFRFVWPSPFALTASCHIHYNMCDGWVEANADICHHRSKLKSAPL